MREHCNALLWSCGFYFRGKITQLLFMFWTSSLVPENLKFTLSTWKYSNGSSPEGKINELWVANEFGFKFDTQFFQNGIVRPRIEGKSPDVTSLQFLSDRDLRRYIYFCFKFRMFKSSLSIMTSYLEHRERSIFDIFSSSVSIVAL